MTASGRTTADRAALREVVVVFVGVSAAAVALTRLRGIAGASEYVHLSVAVLFLAIPVRLAQREPDGLRRFGIDLAGLLTPNPLSPPGVRAAIIDLAQAVCRALPHFLREAAVALAVAALVFPPFALGFYLWHAPVHPFTLHWPADPAAFLLSQLLLVALPEEALFRGYFQTRLDDGLARRVRLLGAHVSLPALLLQAVLFGVMHFLVDLIPARLAVAFPALAFGWLRARRQGIGAATVFHCLSNLYADVLVRGWL